VRASELSNTASADWSADDRQHEKIGAFRLLDQSLAGVALRRGEINDKVGVLVVKVA
jgi:hypothetical protein